MKSLSKNNREILILILFALVAILLWNTPVIYPVKLFVVMLHELSHGMMAELFGGDIIAIQIDYRIGGYCQYTVPQSFLARIMITSAGYLGSLFWGALILVMAIRTDYSKRITLVIGVVLLALSWFVIKTGEWFGITMTIGLGVFMLISYKLLPNAFHEYFLKFLGLISCMYVLIDIREDLIARSNVGSDADSIAQMTGIPSIVVGVIWLLIAFLMVYFALRYAFRTKR